MNKFTALMGGLFIASTSCHAQSLTPMRGEPRSVVETFAVRLVVGNPYEQKQYFAVRVYDDKFYPIAAKVSLPIVKLSPKGSRSVLVVVPFEGASKRRVRICAEGLFGNANTSKLRTQVCGKFIATHIGS